MIKIKNKFLYFIMFIVFISISSFVNAKNSREDSQTLQIYTNFKKIIGKPKWLLIIRDIDTGLVSPYLFDIEKNSNFWIAFSYGHNYSITASTIKFNGCGELKNFCNLEKNTFFGRSMYMTLSGMLTPDPTMLKCKVMKYSDTKFNIVNKNSY
ncbi:hypothetical protein N9L02_02310 [Gammaproteobacteria bacterium]|nr:hypothetical protein [Gammaproteobacteria bacterium]